VWTFRESVKIDRQRTTPPPPRAPPARWHTKTPKNDPGWIEPLTPSGVGAGTISCRVTRPGGATGQIYGDDTSGRYYVNVTS
jgi:hypothetical protein